ncbi:MAG: hypothetical protein WBP44_08815 [Gammaproteobacteria bacterium]|jgi:hypothetical protein
MKILLLAALSAASLWPVTATAAPDPADRHYNKIGFFDVHVCNWPDQPLFLMPLVSTTHYADIEKVDVFYPDGRQLTALDLSRFRTIESKDAPKKQVFINQLSMPEDAVEGWYSARITLKNGDVYTASDYVVPATLTRASGQNPGNEQTVTAIPKRLVWNTVPGATYYQVFIRDRWEDDKLIYTSRLLTEPALPLPPGLIEDGGYYSWIIHARDINEDIRLGDFNSGSLSSPVSFTVDASR